MKKISSLLICILILSAQDQLALLSTTKDITSKGDEGPSSVTLDGYVNANEWLNSQTLSEFNQLLPSLGANSTEKTEVFLRYDKDNIYIAVKAYDSNPQSVFASVLGRDEDLSSDDYIEVVIDTYNDKTNALAFVTNPFGTRRDFEISNNGDNRNNSWNTFWDVSSKRTDFGWSAEYRIPFSSLRYQVEDVNKMGLKVIRYIRGKNETVISPLKHENIKNTQYNLLNAKEVSFTGLTEQNPIYFTPYITSDLNSTYSLNDSETAYNYDNSVHSGKKFTDNNTLDKILSNVGFDLKYKLNTNNTLDLTMNTDFAQAEADNRIINLSRFSVFLPEKRGFFLENANLFNFQMMFGNRLFHSRNIGIDDGANVPVIGGARLSGSQNGFQYGVLNLQTKSVEQEEIESKNYSVVRVRKRIAEDESYIGGIFTNKQSTESSQYNRVYGLDGRLVLGNNFQFLGYASASDQTVKLDNNLAYGLRLNRSASTGYSLNLVFAETQENFDAELGFIRRTGAREVGIWNGWGFDLKESDTFSSIDLGIWTKKIWDASTNESSEFGINIWSQVVFKSGLQINSMPFRVEIDYLNEPWEFADNITIPVGRYKVNRTFFRVSSSNTNNYKVNLGINYKGFYGGTLLSLSPNYNYIVSEKFNFYFGMNYNKINLPNKFSTDGKSTVTRSSITSKLNYSFSAESSLKALIQYDNYSETLGSNIRFRYNPVEGTDLYLVYNNNVNVDRFNSDIIKPRVQSQSVILKFAKTFTY